MEATDFAGLEWNHFRFPKSDRDNLISVTPACLVTYNLQ
jgi:hypothetical protein